MPDPTPSAPALSPAAPHRRTLRGLADLAAAGLVAPGRAAGLAAVAARYAVAVPPTIADLIDVTDPADPLALSYLPDARELDHTADEIADPIGDAAHMPVPGIVHRYPDRVLLKPLHVCPVYCRFCFRREMVGPGKEALDEAELDAALRYIAGRPEVFEVVLTGGDPLVLAPRRLADLLARLAAIPHVGSIRLHSRVPIVTPERVDAALLAALAAAPTVWLALHVNHPRELGADAAAAIARLTAAGVPLVSQTVLLAGVNADVATLDALFRALLRLKVKPYYLHHPDLAPGTGHFRLSLAAGRALYDALAKGLSSLARPTYVVDIPGGHGKVPVDAEHVVPRDGGGVWLVDRDGRRHPHPG
jgi:lysine 2,3-aminomutase